MAYLYDPTAPDSYSNPYPWLTIDHGCVAPDGGPALRVLLFDEHGAHVSAEEETRRWVIVEELNEGRLRLPPPAAGVSDAM